MTYGVYTKDLKAFSLSGVTLETARRYLTSPDRVIVSEKKVCNGINITILWHNSWSFQKWCNGFEIGPFEIRWSKRTYMAADKVVEEYHEPKEGTEMQ